MGTKKTALDKKLDNVFDSELDKSIRRACRNNLDQFNNDNITIFHKKILTSLKIKDEIESKYFNLNSFNKMLIELKEQVKLERQRKQLKKLEENKES
ncbi:MAG: hypothetical protein U9N59_15225 [Campylobacterota bacterium]|nr:hypothetical protein [Campylobacterota bacterium]